MACCPSCGGGNNCYVLADETTNRAILIDAPDDPDTILGLLEENHYIIQDIVLTHAHFDHILALEEVKKRTGAPVSLHEDDVPLLENGVLNLSHYINYEWKPVGYDRLLHDGDTLHLGGDEITVIHTPGHTSGCICLLVRDVLISGDTLFRRSVGRTDHPTGSLQQEIQSIQEKLMPLDDSVIVYPGHGPSTTIGEERRENPYLQ